MSGKQSSTPGSSGLTRFVDIEVTNYSDRLEVVSPGRLQNSMTVGKMIAGQRSPRNLLIKWKLARLWICRCSRHGRATRLRFP
ncbi:MAG: ATP-binding protein [Candidatus Competibacteraceae bacterium]